MKGLPGYYLLFAATLLALMALGSWWTIFISKAIFQEQQNSRLQLTQAAQVAALKLGQQESAPAQGPIKGTPQLEVIHILQANTGPMAFPLEPRYPDLAVRPTAQSMAHLDQVLAKRRRMIWGEGTLLFLLIGVCSLMLARLVFQERRHLQRMESFVSAFTHEMKTPLAGMKSLLQTMAAGRIPPQERQTLLLMGLREAERLEHSIENVLLSGSLRTNRLQVQVVDLDLRPILESFVEHRRRVLVGNSQLLHLTWDRDCLDAHVAADPSALHMILENLVDNALKYGEMKPVRLHVSQKAHMVLLAVTDEGIGFHQHQASVLFKPFHRSTSGAGTSQHGTGLGLTIARTLARRMGGELEAWSAGPGSGATFTLKLPTPNMEITT